LSLFPATFLPSIFMFCPLQQTAHLFLFCRKTARQNQRNTLPLSSVFSAEIYPSSLSQFSLSVSSFRKKREKKRSSFFSPSFFFLLCSPSFPFFPLLSLAERDTGRLNERVRDREMERRN
jgi:hypothetical protein